MGIKYAINLFLILITTEAYLNQIAEATPIDTKPDVEVTSISPESPRNETARSPDLSQDAKPAGDDEILETADFVFRPLFVYRQQQEKRKRLRENRRKANRRKDLKEPCVYYPYRYPYYRPVRRDVDRIKFPAVF